MSVKTLAIATQDYSRVLSNDLRSVIEDIDALLLKHRDVLTETNTSRLSDVQKDMHNRITILTSTIRG